MATGQPTGCEAERGKEEEAETTNKTKAESLAPAQGFVDVRDPHDDSLLFRYDPVRQLVEIRKRKVVRLVDLAQYVRKSEVLSPKS